ncbi:MAG: hypothetical protein JO122_19270 [Acetobacteraceae bacterium]|nr:hypothetical protein [Acetobacteraceae bacterium]
MQVPIPAGERTLPTPYGVPSTFLEQGVTVSFTTAWLRGTRVRPSRQSGMELLVPNLSGAKGVYVLSWREVYQFRRLSRDDVRLYEQLSAMPGVTPAAIREAVRATAAWGMATARPPRDCDRMMTGAPLLFALLDQLHPGGFRWSAGAKLPQFEQRIRQVLHRIAPALGPKPAKLTDEVMQLSVVFEGVGMPGQSPRPRLSALLETVQRLCNSMKTWSLRSGEETAQLAGLVFACAKLTAQEAGRMLAEAHEELGDIPALLREWRTAPDLLAQRIYRTDWLLDGWEPICRTWQNAESDQARRLAVRKIARGMLPLAYYEGAGAGAIEPTSAGPPRRSVLLNEDWRTGTMITGANRPRSGPDEPSRGLREQWRTMSW